MAHRFDSLTVKKIWKEIDKVLQQNPEPYNDVDAIFRFKLFGEEEGVYELVFKDGQAKTSAGSDTKADVVFQMKVEDFKKFLTGKLNGTAAYMTGKLKIKGKIGLALKLEGILRQYELN